MMIMMVMMMMMMMIKSTSSMRLAVDFQRTKSLEMMIGYQNMFTYRDLRYAFRGLMFPSLNTTNSFHHDHTDTPLCSRSKSDLN